jgi:hypothetical protein
MIIDKGTKSKCEIHYSRPVTFSGKTFFSEVKAQSEPSGNMITITISSIKAGLGGQSADQIFLLNILSATISSTPPARNCNSAR